MKPLRDYVLILPIQKEKSTTLNIPDSMKEKLPIAEVIAVGKDVQDVKKGQTVYYKEYNTTAFEDKLILKEEDIFAYE